MTEDAAGEDQERQVDALIEAALTVDLPSPFEGLDSTFPLDRFTDDVARKIWPYGDIARRYGLSDRQFIAMLQIPEVRSLVKRKRAVWNSDANASERLKQLLSIGVLESSPGILSMLNDREVGAANKIELFKSIARIIGADNGNKSPDGSGGAGGPTFAVNITFSGSGRKEEISVSTAPTVVEGEAA